MRTRTSGFTLIELLAVIAIIGLLTAIILPDLQKSRANSRDDNRIAALSQIKLALAIYRDANNGSYPTTLSVLAPELSGSVPADPSSGAPYHYAAYGGSGGTCTGYHLGASLENTHGILAQDADQPALSSVCAGSAADFDGSDASACAQGDAGGHCYDIKQ